MNIKTAESIICNAVIEIHKILFSTTFSALITTKPPTKNKRRRVVASFAFADLAVYRRFFTYDIILLIDSHNQMKVKTLTKSIQYTPTVKLSLQQMYANPDFSIFLPPYRKLSTIVNISVDAIVADFFTAVDKYLSYSGLSISSSQNTVRYFEVLMKQHTSSLTNFSKN